MLKINRWIAPILLIAALGCGESEQKISVDYSLLKKSSIKDTPLSKPSNREFEQFLKNGIRLRLTDSVYPVALGVTEEDSGNIRSQFSATNVHEFGVDEADVIKYDGEHMYQVMQSNFANSADVVDGIRILKTDSSDASMEIVSTINNDNSELSISDIYLRSEEKQLISIKKTRYFNWYSFLPDGDWLWQSGKAEVQLYDVQNPETPTEQWSVEIEGNLEGSRRIGNMLYMVTRYVPDIQNINYAAISLEEKRGNEVLILNTPVSDLLPHYQTNNGAIRPLVSPDQCLVAQGIESVEGYADIVTLSAFDLDSRQLTSSVCLNTNVQGIYSSTSGFYIGASSWASWFEHSGFTALHKFELDSDQVVYKASAAVPGYLGWSDPSFRMSEYQNDLRIITTNYSSETNLPEHQLNILREDGSHSLQTIASLPNDEKPAAIGKPGEELYAVRFSGDRGYAVTFEQIDPLYVLDLSDHESPEIAGELEIPGFSRYLHVLSQDWLLGIGREIIDGTQEGLKVELYDIRDMSNPVVKDSLVFGDRGSFTEVLNDLRSFSVLNINQQVSRFAIPMTLYQNNEQNNSISWKESGLYLFELNSSQSEGKTLEYSGKILSESSDGNNQIYPKNYYGNRSKLHGDAIFYLSGNQFLSALWQTLDEVNGPF